LYLDNAGLAANLLPAGKIPLSLESCGRRGNMKNLLMRLWRDEKGQDLVEYALLLVLISLIAVVSITTVGKAVSNAFSNAAVVTTGSGT